VEDKTFGMKNKKGAKGQKAVANAQHQAHQKVYGGGNREAIEAERRKRKTDKEKNSKEAILLGSLATGMMKFGDAKKKKKKKKKGAATKASSMTAAELAAESTTFGNLTKAQRRNLAGSKEGEGRRAKRSDPMAEWRIDSDEEVIVEPTIEEQIDEERAEKAAAGYFTTQITEAVLTLWKVKRDKKRHQKWALAAEKRRKVAAKAAGGGAAPSTSLVTGRALFEKDSSIFVDDAAGVSASEAAAFVKEKNAAFQASADAASAKALAANAEAGGGAIGGAGGAAATKVEAAPAAPAVPTCAPCTKVVADPTDEGFCHLHCAHNCGVVNRAMSEARDPEQFALAMKKINTHENKRCKNRKASNKAWEKQKKILEAAQQSSLYLGADDLDVDLDDLELSDG
tara:strand:+ start:338 stop:1531 length:1194 start_codon:yes stop_codon:yes gene_type:complete